MADTTSSTSSATCAQCHQTNSSLKICSKCKSVSYCDKDCQKADWKIHKKQCASLAQKFHAADNSAGASAATSNSTFDPDQKPITAILYNNNFLHNRSEEQTFQILIDCVRMRQRDEYTMEGKLMEGSVYDGHSATSESAFRTFMLKAKGAPGFLPPWWSDAKTEECVQYGSTTDNNFSLERKIKKKDVQDSWKDHLMHVKLRMLAEKVYGDTPGDCVSGGLKPMLLNAEAKGHLETVFSYDTFEDFIPRSKDEA